MSSVIVKKSKIEGKGVFAARDIKKGEVVLEWDEPRTLTKGEIGRLPAAERRYVSFHNGVYVLIRPPGRYINHSCDPNTIAKDFCDVAVRDIKKGEEITSNYLDEGDDGEIMGETVKCMCASRNCRGTVRV